MAIGRTKAIKEYKEIIKGKVWVNPDRQLKGIRNIIKNEI